MRKVTLLLLILMTALLVSACGGNDEEATPTPTDTPAAPQVVGDPVAGEQVYLSICVACHGPDAKGLPNLGKSLYPVDSPFVSEKSDLELVEFVKVGRTPDDPLNTTGVGMPAKGGNPAITEQQIYDVIAYIRQLK